jgi:hypothetical protein
MLQPVPAPVDKPAKAGFAVAWLGPLCEKVTAFDNTEIMAEGCMLMRGGAPKRFSLFLRFGFA